ncbi:alpha beta-hydrolase [Fusarium langsethiae]|uniref:Carboxylic ester hydrolase n=1 Tax=Fusarium langsethiae TaxID=179993 RepID=A0A0M9ESE3_FUSLA|nr:alpha beta-hydrolase [Fusarium langsethiae]GKU07109.1 unnamed protein product [Fusarium langsethiae]
MQTMSPAIIHHDSLKATLHGLPRNGSVWQFRGLQYASISKRFALPQPPSPLSGDVDCTCYGPRCPQNLVDSKHLLRIPVEEHIAEHPEDEFSCLNLDIAMPAPHAMTPFKKTALPVMVWIHVKHKVKRMVNINYRLNMFAFGDETSAVNLALKDQRHALEYIKLHIAGFGGDPGNVTLAGESAGAVYTHAHMIAKIPVRQCILQSGTLHLSPPQPRATAIALIRKMSTTLLTAGNWTLRTAPVNRILEAQAALGLASFYLQMETDLKGQDERVSRLKTMYGLLPDRPSSCKTGALDFLNDMRFTLPVRTFMDRRRRAQQAVFGYLMDQPNPWQRSSRAHHGVDLIYLFNGFDFTFDQSAQRVAEAMQLKWIEFICGEDPWKPGEFFAFGPFGESKEVDVADRRRYRHLDIAIALGQDKAEAIVRNLATGKSSLLN